jgi:hypothetical protein
MTAEQTIELIDAVKWPITVLIVAGLIHWDQRKK